MKESIIIGLLQNTAILLAFTMLYEHFWIKKDGNKTISTKIITGFFLSGIGIVLMFTPWTWTPGIVFDTRSVMISISGLFFGLIPTVVIMFITSLVRLIIGGEGQWMGIAVIISSGSIGLLWREYRPKWRNKNYFLELFAMGLIVHLVMSACTIFLPSETIIPTLKTIAIPLIFIYSPATMILGIVMLKQYQNQQNKNAQLKLIESERRFSQILNGGNIVSLLLNKEGNIDYCNNYLLEITGYSRKEIINSNWFDLFISSEEREKLFEYHKNSLESKLNVKDHQNSIISKSGEKLFISWYNINLLSDSNDITGIASIGVDLTNIKNYEHDLEEINKAVEKQNKEYKIINKELQLSKERAEESDRLKSAFLANMSHEIRTPMNGILGFAELLKNSELANNKQNEYISIIEHSGKRMLNIINDIVSISKIESGVIDINISESNINEQVEFVFAFFKLEIQQKKINFSFTNPLSTEESIVKTDREKVYAVLTNLVKNAIKFTSSGSIEIGYSKKGNYLEFFVKDSGVGVNQKQKELIFERFRQGSESLTRNYEGAGLGLTISKAYVEMLGGSIWVENNQEKGSSFYFTIPYNITVLEKANNIINAKESLNKNCNKTLKVLIVDDDETSEKLFSILISSYSKEIIKATNGKEAVEICRNNGDLDLILMDIKMPVLNGHEATKQIREFNKDVVIIAQTAYGMRGDREKALESGCNEYLSKPIIKSQLDSIMQKHFCK
jgi:hypothetical protein